MVKGSCTKERINERQPYNLVKWSRANKKNIHENPNIWLNGPVQNKMIKLMRTLTFGQLVVYIEINKSEWTLIYGQIVVHKRKNK